MITVLGGAKIVYQQGFIIVGNILVLSQTCKEATQYNFEVNWKHLLISHFPSYFLSHEHLFDKDTVWKEEYIKAYRNLALRYMGRANLNKSKVVHFGPTAIANCKVRCNVQEDKMCIGFDMDLIDSYPALEPYCSGEVKLSRIPIFENKAYMFDEEVRNMIAFDLVTNTVITASPPTGKYNYQILPVISNGLLFIIHSRKLHCFDIKTGKEQWRRGDDETPRSCDVGLEDGYDPPLDDSDYNTSTQHIDGQAVAFDNKIFCFKGPNLCCFEASSGVLLFEYKFTLNYPDSGQEPGRQLVIDGDHAIWIIQSQNSLLLLVVYNWRTRNLVETISIPIHDYESFVVSDGLCFISDYIGCCFMWAFELSYTTKSTHKLNELEEGASESRGQKRKYVVDYSGEARKFEDISDPPQLIWKYAKRAEDVAARDMQSNFCVYGDAVYVFLRGQIDNKGGEGRIECINRYNGQVFWRTNFGVGKAYEGEWQGPNCEILEFFIVEGTATLDARKQAIAKRDANIGRMHQEDSYLGDSKAEDEGELNSGDAYLFPLLYYSLHDYDTEQTFGGSLNVYTGEVIDASIKAKRTHRYTVSISKQARPLFLSLTA